MRGTAGALLTFVTLASSRAFGADEPAPPAAVPPPAAAPPVLQPYQPPPPPTAVAPPAYAYPPAYGPPPNYANPYGLNPTAMFLYESQRKNQGIALLLEFLIPGVGSLYAEHAGGAAITWGLIIGGFALILWDLDQAKNETSNGVSVEQQVDVAPT